MDYGYQLFQGREGAYGHARSRENGRELTARGLKGGVMCAVYCRNGQAARCIARGQTDAKGGVRFSALPEGTLFLAAAGRVVLWEKDAPEEEYWQAEQALRREKAAEKKNIPAESGAETPAQEKEEKEEREEKTEEKVEEKEAEKAENRADWQLRGPGRGGDADALPEMKFPGYAGVLKKYFHSCPRIMPFAAPGWRFVRAPSPVPGTAYCALGYLTEGDEAVKIAWAFPGTPHRPPAALPGFRYHAGYWVMLAEVGERDGG